MTDRLSALWTDPQAPATTRGASGEHWEALLGQARRSRLLPRLAVLASSWPGGLAVLPSPQSDYLRGALRLVERQRREVLSELHQMRRALARTGGPVVLLKGAAYLLAGLAPSTGRVFSDLDILVPRAELETVESALMAAGWISEERDAYNQRYYREWMHEIPPLAHVRRGSVIDVHHTIAPLTSRFRVDGARLLERIRPIGNSGFFMLAPEDMVLHSAAHLYQEGEFDHGLRDLLDLHDLLMHFATQPEFWPQLLSRAAELRLGEPLCMLLEQRQRLLGVAAPAEHAAALSALQPSWLRRKLIAPLLTLALRPQHPEIDSPASAAARALLYLRSHHLRMPLHLLVPHLLRKAYMARFRPDAETAHTPSQH